MAKITLSIQRDYQPSWGPVHALRELFANALDAQARGLGAANVRFENNKILITSEGVKLTRAHLLLGTSENRGSSDAIGQFGEGLKLALLVLARDAERYGLSTRITNDDEVWTPALEPSDAFDGAEVLVISTRTVRPRGKFEIEIGGLDYEVFSAAQQLFLALDPDHLKVMNAIRVGHQRVFLDPKMAGRLYVKGVFIAHDPKARFGYELDMEINRDRQFFERYIALHRVASLTQQAFHEESLRTCAKRAKWLNAVLDALSAGEDTFEASALSTYPEVSREALQARHNEQYGEDTLVVSDVAQARELALVGKKAVVVTPQMVRLLGREHEAKTALEAAKTAPTKVYQADDLTEAEWTSLDWARALIARMYPDKEFPSVQVVDFRDAGLLGLYRSEDVSVQLSAKVFSSRGRVVATLLHECLHCWLGMSDGADFERENNEAMIRLVDLLTE